MNLSIDSIIVRDRQRSAPEVDENFVKSVAKRLIHPIVLRRGNNDEGPYLVAGQRRLLALQKAGVADLIEGTHFRYFDDLSEIEAQTIELEENIKRSDLPWRDNVVATAKLHELYMTTNPDWTPVKTSEELNLSSDGRHINYILMIYKNLDAPILRDCQGIKQAIGILENAANRRLATIIGDIAHAGNKIFEAESQTPLEIPDPNDILLFPTPNRGPDVDPTTDDRGANSIDAPILLPNGSAKSERDTQHEALAVLNTSFLSWLKDYNGRKFTFIHVDFPYDTQYKRFAQSVTSTDEDYIGTGDTYWELLEAFCGNINKIASYQSHIMFWFSMDHYQRTKDRLIAAGLTVHNHPLIWWKSDNAGIVPGTDGTWPRRVYETALLCSRGKRPLVRVKANAYGAPTPSKPIHPSQKSEPMLRHFFEMFIDATTDVFDPTCGSASALRAAEDLGARSILGLELDSKYAESANASINSARVMRRIHKGNGI